jgi:hypothetical protein
VSKRTALVVLAIIAIAVVSIQAFFFFGFFGFGPEMPLDSRRHAFAHETMSEAKELRACLNRNYTGGLTVFTVKSPAPGITRLRNPSQRVVIDIIDAGSSRMVVAYKLTDRALDRSQRAAILRCLPEAQD